MESDPAIGWFEQARQSQHEGALARSVWSNHRQHFPFAYGDFVNLEHGLRFAFHDQVLDLDQVLHAAVTTVPSAGSRSKRH